MSSHPSPPDALPGGDALTEREFAILQATRATSLSTVAIAEKIGLGKDPFLVVPLLERLERLKLLDSYYAAGRASSSAGEVHRRYYRSSERGRLLAPAAP